MMYLYLLKSPFTNQLYDFVIVSMVEVIGFLPVTCIRRFPVLLMCIWIIIHQWRQFLGTVDLATVQLVSSFISKPL